jgi:hypothetical protein
MTDNKFVIHGVPKAVIDHLRPGDLDERIELRPLEPLLITTPGRDGNWVYRMFKDHGRTQARHALYHPGVFWTAPNVGKSLPTDSWLVDVPQPHVPEFEPHVPSFTFKDPVLSRFLFGLKGERQSGFERWMDGFHNHHHGFRMRETWDHIEWLNAGDPRHSLRVVIPAKRYSGLNAFELGEPHILKEKKPSERYSLWIVRHVTQTENYWERSRSLHSLIQCGLDEAFKIVKKPLDRMSSRPRIKR